MVAQNLLHLNGVIIVQLSNSLRTKFEL